ncbi:MAG: Carboxypeptidase regulatory-like domain, partial [Bacteroidota bacterium]
MKYMLRKIIALAVVVLSIGVVTAQTNFADFRIKAKDQDGRNMSGVKIVMLLNNIEVATDTTDSDGNVGFATLTPGRYDVKATKEGYPDQEIKDISLQPGQNPDEEVNFIKSGSGTMGP